MKKIPAEKEKKFARLLLEWNQVKNNRQMPWKGEKDPYRIWLSEIILQQTRVEQGLNYYNNFIKTFPTIKRLANANDEKVFKLWEGLGYYTRCRNLLATARYISKDLDGKFPSTYESILALKGVGPYTAAAISSFAFNLPHAVVDGNVFRVLARVFGVSTPTDSTNGKKFFTELANRLLDKKNPGLYNQAIMDFGAIACKPVSPNCKECVFNKDCVAYLQGKTESLPVKEKKISIKRRWFYYLVPVYQEKIAIRQRKGKDIWQGLYEFPLIEMGQAEDASTVLQRVLKEKLIQKGQYKLLSVSEEYKQQLTHQSITARFITIRLDQKPEARMDWIWVSRKAVANYPFPRLVNHFRASENQ